jgi:hypothetical protein
MQPVTISAGIRQATFPFGWTSTEFTSHYPNGRCHFCGPDLSGTLPVDEFAGMNAVPDAAGLICVVRLIFP